MKNGHLRRASSPTRFIVFTSPRSGSSWLIELLDGHPAVAAYAELFLPGADTTPDYGSRDVPRFDATLDPPLRRDRISLVPRRVAYLNRLFAPRPNVQAVGFKLMYGHPEVHPGLLPYLATRRVRAIHLLRENLLDQVLSWETAVARRRFRAYRGDDVEDVAVRLDAASLPGRLENLEKRVARARRTLRRYALQSLDVGYERLRESPQDELARVTTFLRLAPTKWELDPSLVRMNRGRQHELIENYEDVEAALADTRFGWMLSSTGIRAPAAGARSSS